VNGQHTVSRARIVLHDPVARRWSDSELALWINDGCKYIALVRPDAASVNAQVTLAAGTKQSIASLNPPGVRLLDVLRTSAGRGITIADRQEMDTWRPTWHADAAGTTENYIYDNRDPKTYYVWPPASVGAQIDILYSRVPVEISAAELATVALSIGDEYADALLNYVLFRCYAKDAEATHNADLAAMYLQACNASLGVKTTADVAMSPDLNSPGGKVSAGATVGGA
jgi:hypothetical protein